MRTTEKLKKRFISWQCLIRQDSMRRWRGVPYAGSVPLVQLADEVIGPAILLLMPRELKSLITELSFLYKRTHDPAVRRESAVQVMAASFFQRPGEFSDTLAGLFASDSGWARTLPGRNDVTLRFEQGEQRCRLPCQVKKIAATRQIYQFVYWHSALFSPGLPPDVCVLAFQPDWDRASHLSDEFRI